jgi:hypothetical protein
MSLLSKIREIAESLDPDDGIKLKPTSTITIIQADDNQLELHHSLARKIFGSKDNLEAVSSCFTGEESLELHEVKVDDDIWIRLDELFVTVDEV